MSKIGDYLLAEGWSKDYYGHECGSLNFTDGSCARTAQWSKGGDHTYCWQHAYKQARVDHWNKETERLNRIAEEVQAYQARKEAR